MEYSFWLSQVAKALTLYIGAYATGLWVQTSHVKVKYTRSLEGSACVFITSLVAILLYRPLFEPA